MAGGLMGGGRNSLGGSIMNMLSSANLSALMPLLQLLGGGKPQPTDLLQLLSALPKTAPPPAPPQDAEGAPPAENGSSAMLSQLLADPQLLASLAGMLSQMGGGAAVAADAAAEDEMTEDGYIYDEPEADFCAECRAACPRALQLFPSYEQVRQMSRSFPRY